MKYTVWAIEASIRQLQCLLSEMLLAIQVLDIRLAEMAGTEVRLLSHKDEGVGSIPTSAIDITVFQEYFREYDNKHRVLK